MMSRLPDLLHGLPEAARAFASTLAYEYRLSRHRRWRAKYPLRPAQHVVVKFTRVGE